MGEPYDYVKKLSPLVGQWGPTSVDGRALTFNGDGTEFYIRYSYVSLDIFSLSTPWDITTAVLVGEADTGTSWSHATSGSDTFSPDGTIYYHTYYNNPTNFGVKTIVLAAPWDVTVTPTSLTYATYLTVPWMAYVYTSGSLAGSIRFRRIVASADGMTMFVLSGTPNSDDLVSQVEQYSLTAPWAFGGATLVGSPVVLSIYAEEIFLSPDESRIYTRHVRSMDVLHLATPNDLSSLTEVASEVIEENQYTPAWGFGTSITSTFMKPDETALYMIVDLTTPGEIAIGEYTSTPYGSSPDFWTNFAGQSELV